MPNSPTFDGATPPRGRAWHFFGRDDGTVNRIAEPTPSTAEYPARRLLLVGLLVATLLPRIIMALLIPTVCSDGTIYITAAESIEHKGLQIPTGYALNLYPIILAGLHTLGLSWETAGKIWGVSCSSLVIPPLFGWVRRQFDDRTAIFACLLYAGHPKLIEWAPELIREQSFWLLFTTGLYFSWRAAVEVRFAYYLAAAITLALATFTRFEGLFLFIPLLYWTGARFVALGAERLRLVRNFGLVFVAVPCLVLAVKVALLGSTPISECLNSAPLARLTGLIHNFLGDENASVVAFDREHFGLRPGAFSSATLGKTLQVILRGLTPPYAVLLLIGLLTQGRRSLKSDRLPAVLIALVTIGAIWIHTWYSGLASSRYILTVALFSSGTAAAGLLVACRAVSHSVAEVKQLAWRRSAAFGLTSAVFIFGCCDAFKSNYTGRIDKAQLGLWLRDRYGDDHVIYGCDEQLDLIAFYANARCYRLPTNRDASLIKPEMTFVQPDIVLLSNPPLPPASCHALTQSAAQLGMLKLEVPTSNMRRPIIMTALEARGGSNR